MGTTVITVRVGKESCHQDFTVHEDLVRNSSTFFENTLSCDWLESEEHMVRLPDIVPHYFSIYVQWLYTKRLYVTSDKAYSKATIEGFNLISSYILGRHMKDDTYTDTIRDTLIEWVDGATKLELEDVISSYALITSDQIVASSPLQKLLVDVTVWCTSHTFWTRSHLVFPAEFVSLVSVAFSARCQSIIAKHPFENGSAVDPCTYHCHGDEPCYKNDF